MLNTFLPFFIQDTNSGGKERQTFLLHQMRVILRWTRHTPLHWKMTKLQLLAMISFPAPMTMLIIHPQLNIPTLQPSLPILKQAAVETMSDRQRATVTARTRNLEDAQSVRAGVSQRVDGVHRMVAHLGDIRHPETSITSAIQLVLDTTA
jgi:hypothetical protein